MSKLKLQLFSTTGGGSDWDLPGFDPESGLSAREYFKLTKTQTYEPARGLFKSEMRDCVTCIDVLEHIFIADLPAVLNDIFRHAGKAIMLNIACYPAAAMLPNGENAHITVRDPLWWKGVIDVASIEFPKITVLLICSMSYSSGILFPLGKLRNGVAARRWLSHPHREFLLVRGYRTDNLVLPSAKSPKFQMSN